MPKQIKSKKKVIDIIYFNKRLLNKGAKKYYDEIISSIIDLAKIKVKVKRSSALAEYAIQKFSSKKLRASVGEIEEYRKDIEEFRYHLENYIYRTFTWREKILQFINAFLRLEHNENSVNIELIKNDPRVKKTNLSVSLNKFNTNKAFIEIMRMRKLLEHQCLYRTSEYSYDRDFKPIEERKFEKTSSVMSWKKNIKPQVVRIQKFHNKMLDFNNEVIRKLVKYRSRNK